MQPSERVGIPGAPPTTRCSRLRCIPHIDEKRPPMTIHRACDGRSGRSSLGEESPGITHSRLFSEAAGTVTTEGNQWSQAHAEHLRGDPHELCIPHFNGLPYDQAEILHTPGVPFFWPQPGQALEGHHAGVVDAAYWPWPEVRLRATNTRAFVHCDELAHHRECTDTSCITVWDYATARQAIYRNRTFILTDRRRDALPGPDLTPINEWVSRLRLSSKQRHVAPAAFEVDPATADVLRAGRSPAAPPLDPAEYLKEATNNTDTW